MKRKLKVFGWQGRRLECPRAPNGDCSTREIVAAKFASEAARLAGYDRPAQMFNLCETGNAGEIAKALSEPGVIFWGPLDAFGRDREWRKA